MFFTAWFAQSLSLWVLTLNGVTRASARLFVVPTIFRKERRGSRFILHEPCGDGLKWSILRFPSWSKVDNGTINWWSQERWGVSQIEPSIQIQNTCTLAHCQPGPAQGCLPQCLDANSKRHGESQTSFPKSPRTNQDIHPQQICKTWSSRWGLL